MRRGIVLLFISVLSISLVNAQYDKKAKELLDNVSAKYQSIESFSAKVTYTLESPVRGVNESTEVDIKVKGNDKVRLNLGNQIIFIDGNTKWNYFPNEKEVNIMEYEPDEMEFSPEKILNLYKSGYKYLYIEEISENNKKYHVVDLVPEDKSREVFKIKLFISSADNTISAWRIFERSGNRYEYRIKDFDQSTAISDAEFKFDKSKYKGVEVIDLR